MLSLERLNAKQVATLVPCLSLKRVDLELLSKCEINHHRPCRDNGCCLFIHLKHIKFRLQKIAFIARLGFINNATDKSQAVLTIATLLILLVVMLITHFLDPHFTYLLGFLVLLTPFIYFFIGKLLARTKRTLHSQKLFMSNVTHELNNSMSVMQLDSEFALLGTDSKRNLGLSKKKSQELVDALKTDLDGIRNMANIIRNLSTIASYEHKAGQLELSQVNLSELLERLCREVSKQLADSKDIAIDVQTAHMSPVYISGNLTALTQMIRNLLNNAVKYSPKGGRVTASLSSDSREVMMSIKDTGIGISEKDITSIFQPFFRSADSKARKEEGSGLGLAIVHEIAKEHRAKIRVESTLGEGTEISIDFPAVA